MNCDEIVARLADGLPLDDAQLAHAKHCPPCESLVTVDHALAAMPGERAIEPCAALREALAKDCGRHRSMPRWQRLMVPAVTTALLAALVVVVRPRPDLSSAASTTFWLVAAAWIALVEGGMGLLLARGSLGLGVAAVWRWLYVGASVAVFEALVWLSNPSSAHSMARVGASEWWRHWTCAPAGSAVALVISVPIFMIARHTAIVAPEAAGALAGLVAGLGASLSMQMSCDFADAMHYGTIHLVPIALAVVIGALVGRRTMAP